MEQKKITERTEGFYPPEVMEGPFREPIAKLGKMITDRIPQKLGIKKIERTDPEYWALALMISDEEAEIALKFGGIRKPKTLKQMAQITGIPEAELEPKLERMSWAGVLEYNWENPQHEKQYLVPMFVPGSGEFSNMNPDLMRQHPELGMFFNYMTRLPLEKVTKMVPPGGAGIGMHVIPVEKAIRMEDKSISIEHISHWLDKYDGKYAASPCSCRRSRKTYDEGCGDDEEGWCIAVGDMADYVVQTNKGGRYITRQEALAIFEKGEKNGFVHQITNIDGEDKIFAICNCNVNVCYALRTSQLFNTPNMSRSAYVAHVDPKNCVACGRCVEYCPAGAVKLGQKLCKKDGTAQTYPKHDLPGDHWWSEKDWDWDYRDNNRKNCYDTGTAPCKTACPAHIAVEGYLKLASQGRYRDALALIKKNNPLPAICGHICNRRCEAACTRGTIDQAVAIDEVKKFIAMQDLNADTRYIPEKVVPRVVGEFDEKVAIIGAGPAGLSCAFYLAEKGYKPTIFEKNELPGGMLTYGIPAFKLEKKVVQAEIDIIREMGVDIRCGVEVGKDVTIPELRRQGYRAFYIAIGCQGGRLAGVPGEDAEGVYTAVEFLKKTAIDERWPIDGDAVVIGGGNVAIDVSRTAVRCGATKVSQFCLEGEREMPASDEEVAEARADGVEIGCGWGPKEILTENGRVKGIVLKRCVSVFDAQHRFSPRYDEADTITVPCSAVFMAVGQSIQWGNLIKDTNVKTGRGNGALVDGLTCQTDEPDVFAGGDVVTGPKFAIDAIAAGKEAAISIHRFVQPHTSLTIGRNRNDFIELNKDDVRVDDYDHSKRQVPGVDASIDQKRSFRDPMKVFTEAQVKAETARCLECGASVVDENKCIGCGVCTTKCEFDAIHLFRERPECSTMRRSEDKLKYILPNGAKQGIRLLLKRKPKA